VDIYGHHGWPHTHPIRWDSCYKNNKKILKKKKESMKMWLALNDAVPLCSVLQCMFTRSENMLKIKVIGTL
jgi:hypothetical protein